MMRLFKRQIRFVFLILDRMQGIWLCAGFWGGAEKLQKYLGLDCDGGAVSSGNEKFGKKGQILFLQSDLESEFCEEAIRRGSKELGISDYNVAHLSMILLHLKNPFPVLKTVRRHLSPDGVVVVRDIDDGLNLAYPDDDGSFARVIGICGRNETSGYRKSGRQVYTLLRRAGFRNVQLERVILSTCGMDFEAREAFFNVYFSFVLDDLRIMKERYPADDKIGADYEWLSSQYDALAERFQDESFLHFFCPVCGLPNGTDTFYCPEVLEKAEQMALNYMYEEISRTLGQSIKKINQSGFLKMTMDIPKQEPEKELYQSVNEYDTVRLDCCHSTVKIQYLDKEIGIYCPLCGGAKL